MRCKNCNVEVENNVCPSCGKTLKELNMEDLNTNKEETIETFSNTITEESSIKNDNNEEVFDLRGENLNKESIETFGLDDQKFHKKDRSIVPFIGVLAVIVLILGAAFLIYLKLSPKMAFEKAITQSIKLFESGTTLNYDTVKTNFDVNIKVDSKNNSEADQIFDIINKFSISGEVENDYKNNKTLMKLQANYDNSDLLKTDMFFTDEAVYIKLKDLYSKFIKYDFDEEVQEQVEIEDYNLLVNKLADQLKKELKVEYFKKSSEGDYIKNTLTLNEKQLYVIVKNMLSNLKKDEEFMSSLSKISKMEKYKLEEKMDKLINDTEPEESDKEVLVIDLYTSKFSNKIEKVAFEIDDSEGEIKFVDDNNFEIKLKSGNDVVTYRFKTNKENEKEVITVEILSSDYTITLEIECVVKYNEKFSDIDISESVDYATITEEEWQEIGMKIMNNEAVNKLLEDTGLNYFLSNQPTYDLDDYNYNNDNIFS